MRTGLNEAPIRRTAVRLLVFVVFFVGAALNQSWAIDVSKTANPELVGELTKSLSITPAQASGGAGALFGLAKSKLSAADFSKVAASVPGIEGLIKSAPAAPKKSGLSGLESAVAGEVGSAAGLGGLASVAGSFKKLGLSPEMVTKFVPILTQFVQGKGGASVASLLGSVLK
jgi:hypothetical protein